MLALLPLDDRPCNVRFPAQIAAIGGDELLVPAAELLGRFNTPGLPLSLGVWLRDLPPVEALIVSVDMLAYGGLVASRRPRLTLDTALRHLEALKAFRAARPGVPVYGFNILMRLAITMDGDAAVANYYNIMRYARLADEAERFQSVHLREELAKVTAQIPAPVLSEYLAARSRNHDINGVMLDWLKGGVFDYLLITQEDASEYGLHRLEQAELMAHARTLEVTHRMSLHPGADEAALTLLARIWKSEVSFKLHASSEDDMKRIAPFEDRPYQVGLQQHVDAMQGRMLAEGDDAEPDFHLFVNAPVGGSQKDEDASQRNMRSSRLAPFARDLIELANAGKRIALCDVAFPNGADNVLLSELEKRGILGKIAVFGGWNTAGNTTGTVLAQCAALKRAEGLDAAAREESEKLNRNFTFERFVDDWYYQSQVRPRVEKAARSLEISPLNMGADAAGPIEAQTRRELRGFAQLVARRHFHSSLQESQVTLPWARTFEADVRMKLS